MTITIVGHGYVGLVTACVFADFGNKVYVIGHTKEKLDKLKKGDPIIYEPGLQDLLRKNLEQKRIYFTSEYQKAVSESNIVFITVGTPPKADGEADLSAVFTVAMNLAPHLKNEFTVVSCKSTVPIGTNRKVAEILISHKSKSASFAMASCPEFLREGTAISDTLNSDRVVIGSDSKKAIDLLLKLHEHIKGKKVITDLASAELIKYTSNAMLATKISFANLISFYCEKTGADVETVLDAVGLDKRIGRIFMDPGLGYGGSCLPKDVKALIKIGNSLHINSSFLDEVEKTNKRSRENFLSKILNNSEGKNLAIWGLSFKPNTDDIREAPSIYILEKLLSQKFALKVYDPAAQENIKKIFGNRIVYVTEPYEALNNSDGLIILTEWDEFKNVDLEKVKKLLKKPLVFDGRNIYNPKRMHELGYKYFSIGRKDFK